MMKVFLKKVFFFTIFFLAIFLIGLFLPATPRAKTSLLFSKIAKDSLLQHSNGPRVIFIGGSNLSFGLNSQMIKDSLNLNPINNGIHAMLGLEYMINHSLKYIKSGDIVIVIPEYSHFYGTYADGGEELLRTVFDVDLSEIAYLNARQWTNIIGYIPKYAFTKFDPTEYTNIKENLIYGRNSYNSYGDSDKHWFMDRIEVKPFEKITGNFNHKIIDDLIEYKNVIEGKEALLYITYPCYQKESYNNSLKEIQRIEQELVAHDFKILGNPGKYSMPENLIFNTPYHLTKEGVDYRTRLIISDLKAVLPRLQSQDPLTSSK